MTFLKDLRISFGQSLEECAEISEMSIEKYKRYEEGLVNPCEITLYDFAKLCRLMPYAYDYVTFLERLIEDYENNLKNSMNECAAGN